MVMNCPYGKNIMHPDKDKIFAVAVTESTIAISPHQMAGTD